MTIIGTCHFVSRKAAIKYYQGQGFGEDAELAVAEKLALGEIHIGPPKLAAGETCFKIDNGLRWAIMGPPDLLAVCEGALGYLLALPPMYRPDETWLKPLRAALARAKREAGQ